MKKINNILLYVIIAVSLALVFYYFFFGGASLEKAGTLLVWSYILLGLGVLLLVCVPILNIGANPASLKKGGMSIAFLLVLFGIAMLFSSDAQTAATLSWPLEKQPSSTEMKIIDTGLFATYLLLILSVVAILFGTLYASLRKR